MKNYLNKSDFLRFNSCPTAAFYGWSKEPSTSCDDPFLTFLAEEGQAVGRVAHGLFKYGKLVSEKQPMAASQVTRELLHSESVTLFEGCAASGYHIARPDVLIRDKQRLYLIEVKSKAGDLSAHSKGKMLFNMYGDIRAAWRDYVHDLAYQCAVVSAAFPDFEVIPWLLLPESNSPSKSDEVLTDDVIESAALPCDEDAIKKRRELSVLKFFNARNAVEHVQDDVEKKMKEMAAIWQSGERPVSQLRYQCRNCEFRTGKSRNSSDGFHQCWGSLATPEPHIFDLNQLYSLKQSGNKQALLADQKIADGRTSLFDIDEGELHGEHATRQRIQLRFQRENREWIDPQLADEIARLKWPVVFLDFETTMAAIPRHTGLKPYETLPFQFSAHVLHRDGRGEHREWLNTEDQIPTLPFICALMQALDGVGSILVYTDYENRILKEALQFLMRYGDESKNERIWIYELLNSGRIIDQHLWVQKHFFHPMMAGKTSIKRVLPSVWRNNPKLWKHDNFKRYFREHEGFPLNPYETLPEIEIAGRKFNVREGCAAMQVYREMIHGVGAQSPESKASLASLLKLYCELDTASQWMIFEHWREHLSATREPYPLGTCDN